MSPDQKAASIHLAFVFMTIQGRGQHQVRPTEIHRDYFVNVGCLCSDGVFYNRLLKLCRSLFVLVSWQGRSENMVTVSKILFVFCLVFCLGFFFKTKHCISLPLVFLLKISNVQSICCRIRLGLTNLLIHGCRHYYFPKPYRNHPWEQEPLLSVWHQSQLFATLRHPHKSITNPLPVSTCGGLTLVLALHPLSCAVTPTFQQDRGITNEKVKKTCKDGNWGKLTGKICACEDNVMNV